MRLVFTCTVDQDMYTCAFSHLISSINWALPTRCSSQSPRKSSIAHQIDFPTNRFGQDLNITVLSENYSLRTFKMAMAYSGSSFVAGLFLQAVLVSVVMISSVQGLFPNLHHIWYMTQSKNNISCFKVQFVWRSCRPPRLGDLNLTIMYTVTMHCLEVWHWFWLLSMLEGAKIIFWVTDDLKFHVLLTKSCRGLMQLRFLLLVHVWSDVLVFM